MVCLKDPEFSGNPSHYDRIHTCGAERERKGLCSCTDTVWCDIRSGGAVETLQHVCVFCPQPLLPVNFRIWTFSHQCQGSPFQHAAISCIWYCFWGVKMPIWITPSVYLSKTLLTRRPPTAKADCWLRPTAGPTNWNQLQQQAVSWDSWQRYQGLEWASPVRWGPAGEEGWVLHHWSRVTVMDRFREESWWPRFFSCLDSV